MVWEQLLHPNDQTFPVVAVEPLDGKRFRLLFGKGKLVGDVVLDSRLAEEMVEICRQVAKSVMADDEVRTITYQIDDMEEAYQNCSYN